MSSQEQSKVPVIFQDFSKISSELKRLADNSVRTENLLHVFTQIDLDVKALTEKSRSNMNAISMLHAKVDAKLKALDYVEAKHNLMIQRINGVLDELERVLRNY